MNGFPKTSLVIIILLLAVIAFRTAFSPQPAIAASHYQYLVVQVGLADHLEIQKELNRRVAEGWELAAPVVSEQTPGVILIFRKEAN